MANIHIYVQDAYNEAKNLGLQAEEIERDSKLLAEQAEELMSVWRGASALRVEAAMLGRAKDAQRIAHNLEVISDGLYQTAQVYDQAQRPGASGVRARASLKGVKGAKATPKKGSISFKFKIG